jgi:hypothetical protein
MPPKTLLPPSAKKWGRKETQQIAQLIEEEGEIDLEDPARLTVPYIEQIRLKHFRHFTAKNFRLNYRNKLRDYCFGGELEGARRRNGEGKRLFYSIMTYLFY